MKRPRKSWREEVEENLNVTGMKKEGRQWTEKIRNENVLEAKGHKEL
jgi:hypothetical protein